MATPYSPNRYSDQLVRWQEQFQKEGYAICAKHHAYPLLEDRYVPLCFYYGDLLVDLKTGLILDKNQNYTMLPAMSQMMVYSHLYHRKENASSSGHMVSYERIRGNHHVSGWSSRIHANLSALASRLDANPDAVKARILSLGGSLETSGDFSFTLCAFPQVYFTYIYWQGDEEFPSNIRMLYDENILDFMHQESVIILSDIGAALITDSSVLT